MVVETAAQYVERVVIIPTFSILERIVVVETGPARRRGLRVLAFQYPRTDRGG